MLNQDLEQRLKAQVDFPSPPQVATEIIALARDPDIEMAKVAAAVSRDPAMTAKILRIANSAFYAQRRPSQNLRQALVIIGLNAALTLALSFSLVSSMRALRPAGIDFSRFWRRVLLAATSARAFGEAAKIGHGEDIFLAAMLQDMGVLALDRAARDFYSKLPQPATHADWVAYEIAQLGKDHSYYTALMLRAWNLPDRLCKPVEASHSPQMFAATTEEGMFARCVALGSDLAEAVLSKDRASSVPALAQRAHRLLSMSHEHFNEVVARILSLIPETEALYETSILEADDAENLLAEARELLAVRNLHALQEVTSLQATTSVLLTRTEEAEDSSRRDPLTGVLNRPWLDRTLDREFTQAVVFGRDLSVAHVDIDRFKLINEKYGTDDRRPSPAQLRASHSSLRSRQRPGGALRRRRIHRGSAEHGCHDRQASRAARARGHRECRSRAGQRRHSRNSVDRRRDLHDQAALSEHVGVARGRRSRAVCGQTLRPQSSRVLRRAATHSQIRFPRSR